MAPWALVALVVICVPIESVAQGEEKVGANGSIEVGLDSFAQQFRITDNFTSDVFVTERALRDTTDVFTEMRAAGQFEVGRRRGPRRWRLLARASAGTDMFRESLAFELRRRPLEGSYLFDADARVDGRQFRSDSDFSLSSDNVEASVRLHGRRRLGEDFDLGVRVRGQGTRYERRSLYEYDQNRADVSLTTSFRRGWTLDVSAEVGGGRRDVPDSSAISYDRGFARGDLAWLVDDKVELRFHGGVEHREFDDSNTRQPYWNTLVEPEIAWSFREGWKLELRTAAEWLNYEQSTSVYFDAVAGSVGLWLRRQKGSLEVGVEPRVSWFGAPSDVEDEYTQPSVVLRFDWFGGSRLWLSFSEEIGHRDYREPSDDSLDLYSDYVFFRTTFISSFRLREGLSIDAFLSDEPESHRLDADDARLTLITLSLRQSF